MTDPKTEYLEHRLLMQSTINRLLEGVELVQQGGLDGLVEIANTHPDAILKAFEALATTIKTQSEEIAELIEARFELLDQIEKITKQ